MSLYFLIVDNSSPLPLPFCVAPNTMWLSQFLVVSAAMAIACAMPVLQRQTSNSRLLFESTRGIFFENVFTRSNGHLLLTTFDQGRIYSLDPSSPNPEPQLVAQIPGSNSSFGISEISPEVFAISSGNYIISDFRFIRGSAKSRLLISPEDSVRDGSLS